MTTSFRHIVRGLIASPLFTVTAVASLALGIGANTAMFSMIDRVLLRTLPVKAPHELVFLYHPGPAQGSTTSDEAGGPSFSYPMFREMQQQQTPFTGLAGRYSVGASLSYRNNALPGVAFLVSGNYFPVLGVTPVLGRLFTEDEYLLSRLTGIFGALATLLAAIGLYGVLAFNVARRTREIGIRIALGAGAGHVRGLVVREIAVMIGIGTIVGMASAFALGRRVESVLYGVTSRDPLPYFASAAVLTAVALLAAYIPARRATNVDPLVALKVE